VRGVGALLAPGLEEPSILALLEQLLEEQALGRAFLFQQARTELAQDGEVEAGVLQLER
jgi:hypothetical protein